MSFPSESHLGHEYNRPMSLAGGSVAGRDESGVLWMLHLAVSSRKVITLCSPP